MASLHLDNDVFDFDLTTPTPRASNFPPIQIPSHVYYNDALSPYSSSQDASTSPYSSPSPHTDYSTTTSVSLSPRSARSSLPPDDYACYNFAPPVSQSPLKTNAKPRSSNPPRKGDPSYIPRPENAFILFRKDAVMKIRAQDGQSAGPTTGSNKAAEKGKRQRQADMSKSISAQWRALSADERSHWEEMAAARKREHEQKHPEYRYQPSRPGTSTTGRKGSIAKGKHVLRANPSIVDSSDDASVMSEDLAIVVRPTRAPRRSSSISSAASSYASPAISLPSISALSRSGSPYPAVAYSRSRSNSRQWVQPPTQDPSPPPSELFFPRGGNRRASVDSYAMDMDLAPVSESEVSRLPRLQPAAPISSHRSAAASESQERVFTFVPPVTSEKFTCGGSKMPSTPRRPSVRASRSRALSLPHPLQLTQSPASQPEEPTFVIDLGWSPDSSSEMTDTSPSSLPSLDNSWSPLSGDPLSGIPSFSSPESDINSDFGGFNLSEETWMHMLEPYSYQLDGLANEDAALFGYQDFGSQNEEDDCNRPYHVVNLDEQGRPLPFC